MIIAGFMGVGKMWGRGKWWGRGKGMSGGGFGVLAGLSHAIHNLARGMLCVAFLLWTPNYE